jgi:hypothetical protein
MAMTNALVLARGALSFSAWFWFSAYSAAQLLRPERQVLAIKQTSLWNAMFMGLEENILNA